jgi:hypothetical protein
MPKIFKAIESQNSYHELEKAFEKILSLGCQEQYREGFKQFVRFMGAVYNYFFEEDLYPGLIQSEDARSHPGIEIVLERNGARLAMITYRHVRIVSTIANVAPGHFVLKFKIGREIWRGKLTRRDLIWSEAFPGKALRLAAMTEQSDERVSRIVSLYNDEVILQVIPGIQTGNIKILLKGAKIG